LAGTQAKSFLVESLLRLAPLDLACLGILGPRLVRELFARITICDQADVKANTRVRRKVLNLELLAWFFDVLHVLKHILL
jgi:hypothetical protein